MKRSPWDRLEHLIRQPDVPESNRIKNNCSGRIVSIVPTAQNIAGSRLLAGMVLLYNRCPHG